VLSIHPAAQVTAEEVGRVWDVLNPAGDSHITFPQFVEGMLRLKEMPELKNIVPMDVPNRFELLSLLIDSPISEDKQKLIFDKLTWLEKAGIRMLEGMSQPMDRAAVHKTLQVRISDCTQSNLHTNLKSGPRAASLRRQAALLDRRAAPQSQRYPLVVCSPSALHRIVLHTVARLARELPRGDVRDGWCL
jgi:hypothetical protein